LKTQYLERIVRVRSSLAMIVMLAMLAPVALAASPAHASPSFNVNTTADTHDANRGDGICADANGNCSLRAAVEENNAAYGYESVNVPAGTFVLSEPLTIYDSMSINGVDKDQTIIDGNHSTRVMHVRTAELLVCDGNDSSIASYQYTGQVNKDFVPAGTAGVTAPSSIAVNGSEEVYVLGSSGVHRFAADGTDQGLFLDPSLPLLAGFAPSAGVVEGIAGVGVGLYIADYFPNNRILRADLETGDVTAWVDSDVGGLAQPNNLAFKGEDLFVTNASSHQVLRYDGETADLVSVFVDSDLSTPRGLDFFGNSLYVADEDNDRVVKFDATTGDFQGAFVAPGSGGLDAPTEITFGPDGDLYVISRNTNNILRYNGETGNFVGVFVAGGNEYLGSPTCLEWRSNGEGPKLNLSRVTLRNGLSTDTDYTSGLTIHPGAEAMVQYVSVHSNKSSIYGGGIQNWGTLYLNSVEVRNNSLPTAGGGTTASGGGIFNAGKLTIWRSLIAGNLAVRGGGIANEGVVNMVNSTVSGNRASGGGGCIRNVGDGVLNLSFSTITDNHAQVAEFGGDEDWYDVGGGLANFEPALVYMSNTILAGNTDNRTRYEADHSPDCYSPTLGKLISYGDNLFGVLNGNCVPHDTSTDLFGSPEVPLDPKLDPLNYNGGPTRTHKLRSDSPAIDVDTHKTGDTFFDCQKTDQRFVPRPQGRACDIGAFELIRGMGGNIPPGGLVIPTPPRQTQARP
jgi:hypothetical protein